MGINDAAGNLAELPGLIKDGEAFWIGGRNNGAWNTTTTYGTTSILETCNYSAEKLNENIDLVGVAVNFEPLPSGASVVVKTKYDNETAWTDLATFSTDGTSIGSAPGIGISTATNRRFRIESTGGAVINSFQVDLETKPNEQYN
jgi:hypothetical protein